MKKNPIAGTLSILVSLVATVGCATSGDGTPPGDQEPGAAPTTAEFGDFGKMQGVGQLVLVDVPDTDADIYELRFLATSHVTSGTHVVVNAISIPRGSLSEFVSGVAVDLPPTSNGADSVLGYGLRPTSDLPDDGRLVWRRPATIRFEMLPPSTASIRVTLGPSLRADDWTTELSSEGTTLTLAGAIGVSCRTASGTEDAEFQSPFCSELLSEAPGLATLFDP